MGERTPRSLLQLVGWACPLLAFGAPDPSDTREGWKELSLLNAAPARAAFAATAPSREARLGEALAVLQARSRSAGSLADARRRFDALRQEQPDDDVGIAASYYLARMSQLHDLVPDRAAAVAGYRALLAAHPEHAYAQLAAPKLAILLLYDEVDDSEWERRVDSLLALLPQLTAPEAARDFRLTLATALIRLRRDHMRAYPLLTTCLAGSSLVRLSHVNALLLQAAESARVLGRPQEEIAWYTRFLADFPHDPRSDEIRRRLAGTSSLTVQNRP